MSEAAIPGVHAVETLLMHAPERLVRVLHSGTLDGGRGRVVQAAKAAGVPTGKATTERLDALAGGVRHQGIVALAQPPEYADWHALIADPKALLLALDQVTDARNFGAILRSAEAMGATGALVTSNRCARLGPAATRTSAGASELLPVAMETNLGRALEAAKKAGMWVIGADLDGQAPATIDLSVPTVLVIGAEGKGLRSRTKALCDVVATIPISGRTESLNAAVAASVLIYEAARQRAPSL